MKIFFNQFKITLLISVIGLATVNVGGSIKTSDKVAVILSGHELYHEGLKLREALLEKNYDVHLTEVHAKNVLSIPDWSETQLGKDLDGHYKQLLFIVTAHGHKTFGANILWKSLLDLVKLFEQKADEIFIHLQTCFSGDAAERWLPQLGNNVKVLTTSSCTGSATLFNPPLMDWNIVSQIFTGYYLKTEWPAEWGTRASNAHEEQFKKLHCNSKVSELAELIGEPCGKKFAGHDCCTKIHIWKGAGEKLAHWNILPINLTIEKEYGSEESTHVKFLNNGCELLPSQFPIMEEHVDFNPALPMVISEYGYESLVNTLDPSKNWKLRTCHIPFLIGDQNGQYPFRPVPKEFKEKNIKPYSTILEINGKKCVNDNCAKKDLKLVHTMRLGYYNTRQINILNDNYDSWQPQPHRPHPPYDYTVTIIVCIVSIIVLVIVGCGIAYCCCYKKKSQSVYEFRSNTPVEINIPQPHPYPTRVSNRTKI